MSGRAKFWTAVVVMWFVFMFFWNMHVSHEEEKKADDFRAAIDARLDAAEQPAVTPARKSKEIIETAFLDWGAIDLVEQRYPSHPVRQRALEHISLGYQGTEPVGSVPFERLADRDCAGRVNGVTTKVGYTRDDVIDGWRLALSDLQTWLPYVKDERQVAGLCEHRFALVLRRLEKQKPITMKDLGASAGKVASDVGHWWDDTTKPFSGAVDEFKAGYNSSSK